MTDEERATKIEELLDFALNQAEEFNSYPIAARADAARTVFYYSQAYAMLPRALTMGTPLDLEEHAAHAPEHAKQESEAMNEGWSVPESMGQ